MSYIKSAISSQINAAGPGHVWVPTDFAHLGNRNAIDKTLQRMVLAGDLRRVDRGLYDRPIINRLTQRPTTPDYRAIIDAIARRDQLRLLVDGMTAANDLGLTDVRYFVAEIASVRFPTNRLTMVSFHQPSRRSKMASRLSRRTLRM